MSDSLVLLHGWAMNARVFDPLLADLADLAPVALDLPGHGGAPLAAPTLDAWADAVAAQLDDATTVLGWSLGGQLALRLAVRHPQKVARLILLATTPRFVNTGQGEAAPGQTVVADSAGVGWAAKPNATDVHPRWASRRSAPSRLIKTCPDNWDAGISDADLKTFGDELLHDPAVTLLRFLTLQTRGAPGQKSLLNRLRASLAEAPPPAPAALAAGLDFLRSTDLREEIGRVRCPVLVIHGERDLLTPLAAGKWLARALPQAQTRFLAAAAHAPHLSHADDVATAIRHFLDEH